jgi:hypothetical protein
VVVEYYLERVEQVAPREMMEVMVVQQIMLVQLELVQEVEVGELQEVQPFLAELVDQVVKQLT